MGWPNCRNFLSLYLAIFTKKNLRKEELYFSIKHTKDKNKNTLMIQMIIYSDS